MNLPRRMKDLAMTLITTISFHLLRIERTQKEGGTCTYSKAYDTSDDPSFDGCCQIR